MIEAKPVVIGNGKLIAWTLTNTLITVILTSSINFYFQKQNLKDQKLIEYRSVKVESYAATINNCNSLIEKVDSLVMQIKPDDYIPLANGERLAKPGVNERVSVIMDPLNGLGELGMKLPYQMRVVVIMAKNHYGILFNNKTFPEQQKNVLKTENLTALSFTLALEIAKENYIANGEPHHKELSALLVD